MGATLKQVPREAILTLVLCVRHRAEVERETPGRHCWQEAPPGLLCETPGCYRPADAAVSQPRSHTPETRAKVSAAQRGKKHTPEARAKMAAAHRGKKRGRYHRWVDGTCVRCGARRAAPRGTHDDYPEVRA